MVDPYFTMFWDHDIPRIVETDDRRRAAEITVIAGGLGGASPLAPPPNSWAARAEADVGDLARHPRRRAPRGRCPPPTGPDTVRVLYVFEGTQFAVHTTDVGVDTGVVVRADVPVRSPPGLDASSASCCRAGRSGSRSPNTDRS